MAAHSESHHESFWTSPKRMLGSKNAIELGKLYFVLSIINAAIGGLLALMIRWELWTPNADYFENANAYNSAFTLHGTGMIFLVVVPLGAGWGNYLIPRMVAADNNDMYWPRWNNIAFWMLPLGSFFIWTSQAAGGWTAYAPLSVSGAFAGGIDMWILGLLLAGTSSTIGALNFILTIWKGKAPYIEWMKMDLFVWATLLTSLLILIATPVLTTALVMILLDRNYGTGFFDGSISNPVMYQHIFWFYSHPAVYIMVLPAFGLISGVLAKFSRHEIFGYGGMVGAMIGITILSFVVWAHHMYTTGMDPFVRIAFTTMTFAIAIPSGVKVFNWITTLYAGDLKLEVPMLFCLSFIVMFTFGGITGVYVNIIALDLFLHDSYWVVGHFHFIVAAGTLQAMYAAFYYYYPDMTGKMYHRNSARAHFWLWSIGNFVAFTGMTILGMYGMPRRYFTYPESIGSVDSMQLWHQITTVGAMMMGVSFIFFIVSFIWGYLSSPDLEDADDPFALGEKYEFPKPFAEHIKETTGEELVEDHSLTFWAPAGAFALSFPLFAIAAFLEVGPFAPSNKGFLAKVFPYEIWILTFIGIALLFGLGYYYERSNIHAIFGGVSVLLAILAFLEFGPFESVALGDTDDRLLTQFISARIWGFLFVLLLVGFMVAMYYVKSTEEVLEPSLVDKHRTDRHWEIWVFLASETIFFGALIGTGIALRLRSENWPDPGQVLDVNLTAVNTFILIVSSFTMAKGLEAIGKGDVEKLKRFLIYTIILGTIFVSIQAYEYLQLWDHGEVSLETDSDVVGATTIAHYPLFSSAFFIQTGFHGAHVTVGIILLLFVLLRAHNGGYTKENHKYVEFVGLYWHFVDLVWIILFTIVYLI